MKKNIILFFFIFAIISINCNNSQNTDNTEILVIEGKDIWVREYPTDGEVILKLNTGDECKILKKGKEETIKGVTDYWYKIDYNGEIGWVFGSQGSLKYKKESTEIKKASEKIEIEFKLVAENKKLTDNIIFDLLSKHYEVIPENYLNEENPKIKPKIEIDSKQFFIENDIEKVFIISGFKNLNQCHSCAGRTDAILLEFDGSKWNEISFLEDIGGHPDSYEGDFGHVEKFLLFGKKNICALINEEFVHMGVYSNNIIFVGIINNKIFKIAYFNNSEYSYQDENLESQESFSYEFKNNNDVFYDLILNGNESKTYKIVDNKYK